MNIAKRQRSNGGSASAIEESTQMHEELVKLKRALNRANGDLANLQAGTHMAIVLLGMDLTIRRFTPLAERAFNLVATDVGRPLRDIKHNLDLPDLEQFVKGVADPGSVPEREVRDKEGRWYQLRVRPFMNLENHIEGAVLALADINSLKQSEQKAATARDYAEAILQTARLPLLILGTDLRVKTANKAFYQFFHFRAEETEGHSVFELGQGQWEIPSLRQLLEEDLARSSVIDDFEMVHDFAAGGKRSMLLNARRLATESEGQPSELILLSIEDLTERLALRARKRSEIRYRRLFEAARDGILIVDPVSRKITDTNPFMTELLGYPREELLGKELWEIGLLKDEEASQAAFRELQQSGYIRYEDLPLKTAAGESREVEFVSNIYEEDEKNVIQCNIRDITERKKAETTLHEAKDRLADRAWELERLVNERTEKLRETVRELEAFSYSVAHDLRAPLRGMQGFSRMLLEEYADQLDAKANSYLGRIASSALRMDALIQDVLNYTRVLGSNAELTPVDLDQLVRDVAVTYPGWQPPAAHIEVQGTLPTVLGHEGFLTQCVSNLLSNAVKFVAPGVTPRVRIWAEAVTQTAGNGTPMVRIWFENNGIGIDAKDHDRVFRMFERIHPTAEFEGTGIGLTIVRKAVERLGGRIDFKSEPGKGSKFWVELKDARPSL